MAKPEKITARALGRVLARNVAAGRSVELPELLLETAAELAAMQERLKRDARVLRRARRQILEAQVGLAAATESRAAGDAGRQLADFGMPPGVPVWHPEYSEHPESL